MMRLEKVVKGRTITEKGLIGHVQERVIVENNRGDVIQGTLSYRDGVFWVYGSVAGSRGRRDYELKSGERVYIGKRPYEVRLGRAS